MMSNTKVGIHKAIHQLNLQMGNQDVHLLLE